MFEITDNEEEDVLHHHTPIAVIPGHIKGHFSQARRTPIATPLSATKRRLDVADFAHTPTPKRVRQEMIPGSPGNPLEISDEDESPQALLQHIIDVSKRTRAEENAVSARPDDGLDSSDLTINDYMTDAEVLRFVRKLSVQEDRKAKAKLDERVPIPSYSSDAPNFRCKTGKTVELADATFLYIKNVLKDGHGKIFLSGYQLVRQNSLGFMMPKRRNEVVLIRKVPESTDDAWSVLHQVSIEDVRKNRVVFFTNQNFPRLSSREDDDSLTVPEQDVRYGPLFCRWVFTTIVDERKKVIENIVERLDLDHTDETWRRTTATEMRPTRVAQGQLREDWRQLETILGGSYHTERDTIELDGSIEATSVRSYTFGDAFCGAGGTSRGAVDAGLRLLWGFDNNEAAMSSYRLNFERLNVDCRNESVNDFITHLNQRVVLDEVRVDVLHVSPPCQPFSPAHTIPSQERDEMNQAALPSVYQLVDRLRPRIVTIEETEGLFSRHREWFNLLINTLSSFGYSVRWKVVQCHSYGVPQTRKRLIIVAAGPGERLPPFPRPTRSNDNTSNLKQVATINSTITNIPYNADDHDQSVRFRSGGTSQPFDGNRQAKTITTNAGQGNYHPSGQRPYTLRELACLQTFPLYHSFAGGNGVTDKRRQIGNAVPPILAKAMFKEIVKSLKKSDEAEMRRTQGQK